VDIRERIKVSCLRDVIVVAREWRASHVISLVDPTLSVADIPSLRMCAHHVFQFFDHENPETTAHFDTLAGEIVSRIESVVKAADSRLLLHCHAGASRSPAFAYGALAMARGPGREAEAFADLLTITHKPWPNRRIIEALDNLLGRGGDLIQPLDSYRTRFPRRILAYRRLNRRRGLVSRP
jgi:predicted protein tyrosine phosphatase